MISKNLMTFLAIVLVAPFGLLAQGYDVGTSYDTLGTERRLSISDQAMDDLKNGVLVVRLKTGNNKLEALRRVAESPNVTDSERIRFQQKKEAYQERVLQENEWLVAALKKNYTFSEVLFMLDTSAHQLKAGKQSGYFLDEKMEVDASISLAGRPCLVLFHGQPISSAKSGVEGLVVLDAGLNELVSPFPFFTNVSTIRRTFGKIFNKKGEDDFFDEMVEKFQKRLEEG